MDYKRGVCNYKGQNIQIELESELTDRLPDIQEDEHRLTDAQEQPLSAGTLSIDVNEEPFADVKQFPENPFHYFESNQVNVRLNSGDFTYEVTDFTLPGRDGFDLEITRRYDMGCANLVDMDPSINQKTGELLTGSKDNGHNNRTFGLGFGWSFALPSIERVSSFERIYNKDKQEYEWGTAHDYVLHLDDGRSLGIHRVDDRFVNYKLADIKIQTATGDIAYPLLTQNKTRYDVIIDYKNGNRDFFKNEIRKGGKRNIKEAQRFSLVARQDKFGNTIYFDMNGPNGMVIVDTWGRKLRLKTTETGFVWELPGGSPEETYHILYEMSWTGARNLAAATDMSGYTTRYQYYDPNVYKGSMNYGFVNQHHDYAEPKAQRHLLLKEIIYPNRASTQFVYEQNITLENEGGRRIKRYGLVMKKDVVEAADYNRVEYSYTLADKERYIESSTVTNHQDIKERYQFSKTGQLLSQTVSDKNVLISRSSYEYDKTYKMLMTAETARTYRRGDVSKEHYKKTDWEYSKDRLANVVKETVTYRPDNAYNEETRTSYDKYNMVTQIERFKGPVYLKETYDLNADLDKRVVTCKQVYDNMGLKEKICYEYHDPQNPFCITSEKQYVQDGSGSLEHSSSFIETVYTYGGGNYTHDCISRERKNIKDADGRTCGSVTEVFDYDQWGRIISKTDPRGNVSRLYYDKLGRIEREELPSGTTKPKINHVYYKDDKNYITKTDASGMKTRLLYTPFGKVQRVCLAADNEPGDADVVLQDYQYNRWEELEKVITYDGNGTNANYIRKTENYTYDSFGRVLTRTIPQAGYTESYFYEEVYPDPKEGGKLYFREKKTVWGDSDIPDIVSEAYKDQKGQVRKEFLANLCIAVYEYDNSGNRIRKLDALNKEERWEYDYAGRMITSIRVNTKQEQVVQFEYDALGNKRSIWDEDGNQTEFIYDAAGRLIQTNTPFDHRCQTLKYYYDAAGNMTQEMELQNDGWKKNQHVYDAANRLSETYQYLNTDSWIRTVYQYDVMDRVITARTGDTQNGAGTQITKYTYDRFGNILTMTDACGAVEYSWYDKTGRMKDKTDRNGNRIIYEYDALDRLTKETAVSKTADGEVMSEHEYTYGKTGRKIRELGQETAEGGAAVSLESRFTYDGKGQLIRQQDPGNVVKTYTYDACGNRQSLTLTIDGQVVPDNCLYYFYDDLHRLIQVRTLGELGKVLVEYEYDKKGNRCILRYPQVGMETAYSYNLGNRITLLENRRNGTVSSSRHYVYDVNGNMLSKTESNGSSMAAITYRYDRLGRLTQEDHPGWKRVDYTYDACSNRTRMTVEGKTKDELFSVTSYEYGPDNRLLKERKKQGKITETFNYRYDGNGNEIFRIWEKTAPKPEYPGNIRFAGSLRSGNPTIYEWRHYNGFQQLIRVNQDEQEITYQYRADGLRHSSEVRKLTEHQSKTSRLYWDENQVIAEQMEDGSAKCYQRGINLIAGKIDGVVYYYIHNEHGDIAERWKENGTRKSIYEYDAFGCEKDLDEKDENPFRYCGEYFDVETKTLYLRKRNYRASTGRFTQTDPHWNPDNMIYGDEPVRWDEGSEEEDPLGVNLYTYKPDMAAMTQSSNRYVYGMNNPVGYQDPSGEFAMIATLGAAFGVSMGMLYVLLAVLLLMFMYGLVQMIILEKDRWGGITWAKKKGRDKSKDGAEKGKGGVNSEVHGESESKKKDPAWAPDPDKSVEKQLQGQGQLKDLRNNPNTEDGVDMNELLKKTPRQLEEMKRNGKITQKTLTQIKKAFQGRDLGKRGKNK